jgi:hypothetical protein
LTNLAIRRYDRSRVASYRKAFSLCQEGLELVLARGIVSYGHDHGVMIELAVLTNGAQNRQSQKPLTVQTFFIVQIAYRLEATSLGHRRQQNVRHHLTMSPSADDEYAHLTVRSRGTRAPGHHPDR